MSILTQLDRLNNVKGLIKTAIVGKGVDVPTNAKLDECVEYIYQIESKHADTVDGWHIDVRSDGSDPPSGTTATISFVYTGG